jgi:hypothetical protein
MCCKIMGVEELGKPLGHWCPHVVKGKGCGIYADRPHSCQTFECVWLQTQSQSSKMILELRPDKSKVMLITSGNGNEIVVECDPNHPNAWKLEPMLRMLTNVFDQGVGVSVRKPDRREIIMFERVRPGVIGFRTRYLTDPDERGMQQTIPVIHDPRSPRHPSPSQNDPAVLRANRRGGTDVRS